MRCIACKTDLPANNYALVEGTFYCFKCLREQYFNFTISRKPCQNCGTVPWTPQPTTIDSNRDNLRSNTSSSDNRSTKTSVQRSNTVIEKPISQRQSSSSSSESSSSYNSQQRTRRSSYKSTTTTCQVCYDEKSPRHFGSIHRHSCHQTERSICDTCMYHHIQQALQEICTDDVRCPELNCGTKFEYDTIKKILISNDNTTLFDRYDRFMTLHQLEQMDEFIWCSNPKCAMGQLNDGGKENNIVTCIRCRTKTCFTHKVTWHAGLTCNEYELKTDGNDQASMKWITQNTKQCPKCSFRIEKNDGCDHMTCIKCRYEFCWACLVDFDQIRKDGNHRHDSNCKHYAAYHRA